MKLQDIVNFQQGFIAIAGEKLDFKLTYRLTKIIKHLEKELSAYEAARKVLFEKHGKKNDKGELQVPPEKVSAFHADLQELLEQEVEIVFEPIPFDLLEKLETIQPQVLCLLSSFLDWEAGDPIDTVLENAKKDE